MKLMTVKQIAALFNVTERTVQLWCQAKALPHLRIKGTTRILAEKLPEHVAGFDMSMLAPQDPQMLATRNDPIAKKKAA